MKNSRRMCAGFRSGSVLGVAVLSLALGVGCSKKKAEPEKATTPAPSASATDPNADGKRLERSLTDWKRRWDRIALEGCEPVLKEAAELELCSKANEALTKVKEFAAKTDKSPEAMRAAGDLILAAENAVEKLRLAAASELAKPGASGAPKAAASAPPKPKLKAAGSAAPSGSGPSRVENPQMKVVSSYERVARTAARYLGSFLQQGPLEVRKQAFAEVQRLVPQREKWSALRDVVRQASLTEREPELRKQLRETEQKLRPPRPTGAPSGASPMPLPGRRPGPDGMPPGHPPIERPARPTQ